MIPGVRISFCTTCAPDLEYVHTNRICVNNPKARKRIEKYYGHPTDIDLGGLDSHNVCLPVLYPSRSRDPVSTCLSFDRHCYCAIIVAIEDIFTCIRVRSQNVSQH